MIHDCDTLPKQRMIKLLEVSRSGYYAWLKRKPSLRAIENQQLDAEITRIYWEHNERYGYRRIHDDILEMGLSASSKRVRRRMRLPGLRGFQKRKFKHTTDSHHTQHVAPNLLNQDFSVSTPDHAWVGDITYVRVKQQWVYLAVIVDLYSRKVIGWSMSHRINAELVCDALKVALRNRNYPREVIVHSDRGSQYCSRAYQRLLKYYQLKCSMSGKGNCYDNAVCESFFHTLKMEQVYRSNYQTTYEARASIFWYIEAYYNRKRKHSSLGYVSPVNFEIQTQKCA